MALPKVQHPTVPLLVPSHRRAYRFRPFTVKEEKILLMARESTDPKTDQLRAIHQVVTNCSIDPELNVDSLATFDLEWLYVKLTAISVGPTVTQSFIDKEERTKIPGEPEPYTFTIKLDDVHAPEMPEGWIGFQVFTSGEGTDSVMMGYPPAVLYTDQGFSDDQGDLMLYRCTKEIMTPIQSFSPSEFTREEVVEYFDSWQSKDMARVWEFLNSTPSMRYEISYTNKLGSERKIVLSSLSDFFTF